MKKKIIGALVSGLFLMGLTVTADATLLSRLGGQAVYDTDRDITWIADANLAASNIFGLDLSSVQADGSMSWTVAHYNWLPALNADGGTGYLGFNDWRFPATLQPDLTCNSPFVNIQGSIGFGCTGSEMGHLFYEELGGTARMSILDSGDPDLALFTNLQVTGNNTGIWSELCCLISNEEFAYYFIFDQTIPAGQQASGPKLNVNTWVPWAVRDGDVASVPEPSTLMLLGIGLVGLGWMGRRRRKSL